MIAIDMEKCTECNRCYEICFDNIIKEGPSVDQESNMLCASCGQCVAICPEDAIMLVGFEDVEIKPLPSEKPVDGEKMMSLLRGRRSVRKYKDQPVSREDLDKIIHAASMAPSAHNWRSIKAYVYTDDKVIKKISDSVKRMYQLANIALPIPGVNIAFSMMGHNLHEFRTIQHSSKNVIVSRSRGDRLFFGAKTMIAFTASRNDSFGAGDAWVAAQNAATYAETINVGTCYQGYATLIANWDPMTRSLFKIPMKEKIVALMTLGYPDVEYIREAPRKSIPTTWM